MICEIIFLTQSVAKGIIKRVYIKSDSKEEDR